MDMPDTHAGTAAAAFMQYNFISHTCRMYDLFFYILSLQPAQTYNKPEMTGNLVHKSHCIFWIYISQI